MKKKQLYFAYGSNLVAQQMRQRCPQSRQAGKAYLPGWRIAFGGDSARWGGAVADAVRDQDGWVDGMLYEIDPADLQALDGYEGHPWTYTRRRLWVTQENGREVVAHVYVQTHGLCRARVSGQYFKKVYDAYRRLGFDTSSLIRAKVVHNRRVAGDEKPAEHLVFTYGTLLRGEPNHYLLAGARFQGEAQTGAHYQMYSLGGFPGAVSCGSGTVRGEVYQVDDETRDRLDRLEGHPNFYQRTKVRLADGRMVEMYLLGLEQVSGCEQIVSGDWKSHVKWGKELRHAG